MRMRIRPLTRSTALLQPIDHDNSGDMLIVGGLQCSHLVTTGYLLIVDQLTHTEQTI
jgi:hypothetical protein